MNRLTVGPITSVHNTAQSVLEFPDSKILVGGVDQLLDGGNRLRFRPGYKDQQDGNSFACSSSLGGLLGSIQPRLGGYRLGPDQIFEAVRLVIGIGPHGSKRAHPSNRGLFIFDPVTSCDVLLLSNLKKIGPCRNQYCLAHGGAQE